MKSLLSEIRSCEVCANALPHGVRPVVRGSTNAKVVIIGQAPGRRVHESGIPWDDPSGVRLRDWLGVSDEEFYNEQHFAILPMGFCYPGTGKSGDLPPRPECAPLWHPRFLDSLKSDPILLIIGMYAQRRYLPEREKTLTASVLRWKDFAPRRWVLPHPSPRNVRWFKTNPWFEKTLLPSLRETIRTAIATDQSSV